jgi:hypothetical protein
MAEIAGIPNDVLKEFSKRRLQVLDYLERQGSSGFYAAKVAAISTRDRKEPIDLPRLREEWRARAAEHGLGRRQLKRLLGRTVPRELDQHEISDVAAHLAGPEGLTEKRSTFAGTEAVMAWAEKHVQGAPADRVLALVQRFLVREDVTAVTRAAVGRPGRFSTDELLRHERAALKIAAPTRHVLVPVVSDEALEQLVRERTNTLSGDQEAMAPSPLTRIESPASSGMRARARPRRSGRWPRRFGARGTSLSAQRHPGWRPRTSKPRPESQA